MQTRDRSISRDVAEYLLSIAFDEDDTERMNALAERAREGNLTTEEAAELDSYLHVGSLLSILQSKARRLLKSEGPAFVPSVNQFLVQQVWLCARPRCEYCRIPYPHLPASLPGRSHHRPLARRCRNARQSGDGRTDRSGETLRFDGPRLVGLTPIGRATIHVLAMNGDDLHHKR